MLFLRSAGFFSYAPLRSLGDKNGCAVSAGKLALLDPGAALRSALIADVVGLSLDP